MKRAGALLLLTTLALSVCGGSQGRHSKTPSIYVLGYDCISPSARVRPATILMGCDGGQTLEAIKWTAWTPTGAVGRGISAENTCTPDCAAGHFIRNRIAIRLLRPKLCSGVRQYTRISYTYIGNHLDGISASDARKTWGAHLGCR